MIFGIDALLDMGRTACNVTGDLAATCIVAKTEDAMDSSCWKKEDKPSGQLIESLKLCKGASQCFLLSFLDSIRKRLTFQTFVNFSSIFKGSMQACNLNF